MKTIITLAMVSLMLVGLAPGAPAIDTGSAILWNGVHWQQISPDGKAGYIFGLGNLADFEVAAAGKKRQPCISRAFVDELKSQTVAQIIQDVDKFYQENPSKLDTPVIEVVLRRCTKVCQPETQKRGGTK